jgi:hypothetical protein
MIDPDESVSDVRPEPIRWALTAAGQHATGSRWSRRRFLLSSAGMASGLVALQACRQDRSLSNGTDHGGGSTVPSPAPTIDRFTSAPPSGAAPDLRPPGTDTPPPTSSSRFSTFVSTGGGLQENMSVFGGRIKQNGVYLPAPTFRANAPKGAPDAYRSLFVAEIDRAHEKYLAAANDGGFRSDRSRDNGPRLCVTLPLACTATHDARPGPDDNDLNSILNLAECAKGDFNWAFREAAVAVTDATTGGYDWVSRLMIAASHECNGAWYASYFGVQPSLVGRPELVNASDFGWGKQVAAALRMAGTTGDRGPVWALAWKQCVDTFRSVDSRFGFSLNLSQGSANPDGLPAGDAGWNLNAIETIGADYFDSFDLDLYCRGNGKPTYNGSGDRADPSGWTFSSLDETLSQADEIVALHDVPLGFGEFAAQYDLPGNSNSDMASDEESAVWYTKLFAWYDARRTHQGFVWRPDDGPRVFPSGTTYRPDPDRQPLTWAVFQRTYPD